MAQWLGLHAAHARGMDLVPDWGGHVLCVVAPPSPQKNQIINPQSEFRLLLCKGRGRGPLQLMAEQDPYWSLTNSMHLPRPYYTAERAGQIAPLSTHCSPLGDG